MNLAFGHAQPDDTEQELAKVSSAAHELATLQFGEPMEDPGILWFRQNRVDHDDLAIRLDQGARMLEKSCDGLVVDMMQDAGKKHDIERSFDLSKIKEGNFGKFKIGGVFEFHVGALQRRNIDVQPHIVDVRKSRERVGNIAGRTTNLQHALVASKALAAEPSLVDRAADPELKLVPQA